MFQVELRLYIRCSPEDGSPDGIELRKAIELPFAPHSGISLGLEPDSDFYSDEYRISKVMWLVESQKFLVKLNEEPAFDNHSHYMEAVEWSIEAGWRYVPCALWNDKEDAAGCTGSDECLVKIGDQYAPADEMERNCLKWQGTPFDIVAIGE